MLLLLLSFFCEDGGRKESDSMEFEQMSGIEYLKCILCSRAYWAMWTKFHLRSLYDEGLKGSASRLEKMLLCLRRF